MSRRWHPKGGGWIRTVDYGRVAVWMRPHPLPIGVEIMVYTGDSWGWTEGVGEVWHVMARPHSWMPRHVQDKPHRIRWVLDDYEGTELLGRFKVHSHRRHPRENSRRWINMWPLPRKIVRALAESPDQLRRGVAADVQSDAFPAHINRSFEQALEWVDGPTHGGPG